MNSNVKKHAKNANKKVDTFNNNILNVLSNFIPHEIIICDDRGPQWLNNKIKSIIYKKTAVFKKVRCDLLVL